MEVDFHISLHTRTHERSHRRGGKKNIAVIKTFLHAVSKTHQQANQLGKNVGEKKGRKRSERTVPEHFGDSEFSQTEEEKKRTEEEEEKRGPNSGRKSQKVPLLL